MRKEKKYSELKPVVSIWILVNDLLTDSAEFYHRFQIYDPSHKVVFSRLFSLCTLELNKIESKEIKTEKERWTLLFKDGKSLDEVDLPEFMKTPEMRQAMNTMIKFSEKERNHDLYLRRQDYLLEQLSIKSDYEEMKLGYESMKRDKEQIVQQLMQAAQEKELALRKAERYLEALKKAGVDPEEL